MHLILTGATGLVGSCVLDAMIKAKDVSRISILSRRPVKMAEDAKDLRINVIIHKDFEKYDDDLMGQLKGADGCVWALGTAQSQVSREDYVTITKTFALAAATAFSASLATSSSTPFRFVYVAGGDTTTKPGLLTAFQARIKGETELALAEICKTNSRMKGHSVRPFAVDMTAHEAIKAYVGPRTFIHQASGTLLLPVFRGFAKNQWAPTGPLGEFLTELAIGRHDGVSPVDNGMDGEMLGNFAVWSNKAIRQIKGY